MIDTIRREPALLMAAIQSALALVLAFGIELTVEQAGAILAVSAAILGLVTRSQVSPHVPEPEGVDL